MKSAVLARPNLKALLLGAILIALVENFIANGHSQATFVHARIAASADMSPESVLQGLLKAAEDGPTADLYIRISRHYERQGDMKKALSYFRKAEILARFEEESN